MSYQTNPIITRTKITRNWNQIYFPQTQLRYSYEILTFLKLFSIVTLFFNKKNIKLLSYSFITDNQNVYFMECYIQQILKSYKSGRNRAILRYDHVTFKTNDQLSRLLGLKTDGFGLFRIYKNKKKPMHRKTISNKFVLLNNYKNIKLKKKKFNKKQKRFKFFWPQWQTKRRIQLAKDLTQTKIRLLQRRSIDLKLRCKNNGEVKNILKLLSLRIISLHKKFSYGSKKLLKKSIHLTSVWNQTKKNNIKIKKNSIWKLNKLFTFCRNNKLEKKLPVKQLKKFRVFKKLPKKTVKGVKKFSNRKWHKRVVLFKKGFPYWKKQKKTNRLKTLAKKTPLDVALSLTNLILQNRLKILLKLLLLVKQRQILHKLVSTKYLLNRKGQLHRQVFGPIKHVVGFKNILRSNFFFTKYNAIHIVEQTMQYLFEIKRKKQRIVFEFFKKLMLKAKPKKVSDTFLSVRGRINARPRARRAHMGRSFNATNTISFAQFTNQLSSHKTYANAKIGSYGLKMVVSRNEYNK